MAAAPLDKLKFLANLSINRSTWLLLLLLIVCNISKNPHLTKKLREND